MGHPDLNEQRHLAALYCPDLVARLDALESGGADRQITLDCRREIARELLEDGVIGRWPDIYRQRLKRHRHLRGAGRPARREAVKVEG